MKFMVPVADPPRLFLDTSALVAVFDKSDQWHKRAIAYWNDQVLNAARRPKVVLSDYIIDELATHIRSLGHATAVQAVELILDMIRSDAFQLVRIDKGRFDEAWGIYKKYDDHDFSFTDCTSFVVCSEQGSTIAFAFDSHYQTYGILTAPR